MYKAITDWSEVWALVFPLGALLWGRNKAAYLQPVRIYVIAAFIINLFAISIQEFKLDWGFEPGDFLYSNNFLYNIHSVLRLLLFSWFFILLKQDFLVKVKKFLPVVCMIALTINFIFFENFLDRNTLSSRLLATEAAVLLFYCFQYYIFLVLDEKTGSLIKQKGIWIVTGLTFYVAASFLIFLFYDYLIVHDENFAIDIWDVHNFFFVLLCIGIAINLRKKNEQ